MIDRSEQSSEKFQMADHLFGSERIAHQGESANNLADGHIRMTKGQP
jgi:hypothetical protein